MQLEKGRKQIRTDPFSPVMVTHEEFAVAQLPQSPQQVGEDAKGVMDDLCACHLSSAEHHLPCVTATSNLTPCISKWIPAGSPLCVHEAVGQHEWHRGDWDLLREIHVSQFIFTSYMHHIAEKVLEP